MMSPQRGQRTSLIASFGYALQGLRFVLESQRNFRIHLLAALCAVLLAAWLRFSSTEWTALLLVIGMVLEAELFNTAAEVLVDLASPHYHPLAKQVKDVAAGAVLLAALVALLVGGLLFAPPLLARLGGG